MDREDSEEYTGDLGELPGPLRYERGEVYRERAPGEGQGGMPGQTPGGYPAGPGSAGIPEPPSPPYQGDVTRQSAIEQGGFDGLPSRAPALDHGVNVTYPAQPINSIGLYHMGMAYLSNPNDAIFAQPRDSAYFVVPEGYVAVVRRITWYPTEPVAIDIPTPIDDVNQIPWYAFQARPIRNGTFVQLPQSSVFGSDDLGSTYQRFVLDFWHSQEGDVPVYLLGRSGDEIGINFITSDDFAIPDNYQSYIICEFFGELLPDRGRELPLEPSNVG